MIIRDDMDLSQLIPNIESGDRHPGTRLEGGRFGEVCPTFPPIPVPYSGLDGSRHGGVRIWSGVYGFVGTRLRMYT